MGTPPQTPATESPQIIIPARDAMPAGLSKVPSWFTCGTLAVQAHFEEGIRDWGLPRLKKSLPFFSFILLRTSSGLRAGMVCISGFQLLSNLGPQKTQQMAGSPSVFWKEAACTPPISQVPNPLFHSWLYGLTAPPPPHPATDSPSMNWALPHSTLPALGFPPVGCCLGNQGAVGTSCWPRYVSIKLLC